ARSNRGGQAKWSTLALGSLPLPAPASEADGHAFKSDSLEEWSKCAKMARSAPRPRFRGPGITALVRAASLSCENAAHAKKFTPVRGSYGESRSELPAGRAESRSLCSGSGTAV